MIKQKNKLFGGKRFPNLANYFSLLAFEEPMSWRKDLK